MIGQPPSLVSVLRQFPYLAPEDSVNRAVDMMRQTGSDPLPVVSGRGRLVGALGMDDLRPLLADDDDGRMLGPVGPWVRKPERVGHSAMSVDEARRALASGDERTLFIVDAAGHYLGSVSLADLLVPLPIRPRPASVGGMATPWGVYLTSGTLQAGASNVALVLSGVVLGLLLVGSNGLVGLASWALEKAAHWPVYALWNADQPAFAAANIGWYALHGLPLVVFLLLLRRLTLTGYHAAEHQTVHTMERGEPLRLEIARRMPRVHPRCGTNLMAAGVLFGLVSQVLPALRIGLDAADSAVLGAIVAVFTWRSFGAWMQQHFTTRPATDRQLQAGLAAAEQLEDRYLSSPPSRPSLRRRLWCSGMLQTGAGVAAGTAAAMFVSELVFRYLR